MKAELKAALFVAVFFASIPYYFVKELVRQSWAKHKERKAQKN